MILITHSETVLTLVTKQVAVIQVKLNALCTLMTFFTTQFASLLRSTKKPVSSNPQYKTSPRCAVHISLGAPKFQTHASLLFMANLKTSGLLGKMFCVSKCFVSAVSSYSRHEGALGMHYQPVGLFALLCMLCLATGFCLVCQHAVFVN